MSDLGLYDCKESKMACGKKPTVKFAAAEDNTLEVWEFEPEITSGRLVIGANYALCCWRVQRGLCKALNAPFNPPHASHMGYVSAGVLDAPTTGWFITTDLYNGDIRTLQTMHLHHITKDMPALISVLALPAGFRFTVGGKTGKADIWYDERVATERSI